MGENEEEILSFILAFLRNILFCSKNDYNDPQFIQILVILLENPRELVRIGVLDLLNEIIEENSVVIGTLQNSTNFYESLEKLAISGTKHVFLEIYNVFLS